MWRAPMLVDKTQPPKEQTDLAKPHCSILHQGWRAFFGREPDKIMSTDKGAMFEVWRLALRSKRSFVLSYPKIVAFTTDVIVLSIKMVSWE
jgi:hypothetical protein